MVHSSEGVLDIGIDKHGRDGSAREFPGPAESADGRVCDLLPPLLAAVFDQIALGIAIVGIDGVLIHANQPAIAALDAAGLRISARGTIESVRPCDNIALESALAAAAAQRRTIIALGGDRRPTTIAVEPLATQSRRAACAMVVFGRAALCEPATLDVYARAHNLTPSEETVLDALCTGLRAKEVALRTRSSIATVRSHLRSIYRKTHARNLQDLLVRLASLPPMTT